VNEQQLWLAVVLFRRSLVDRLVVVVGRGISTKPGESAVAVAGDGAISTKPGGSAGGGGLLGMRNTGLAAFASAVEAEAGRSCHLDQAWWMRSCYEW